MPAGRPSKYKEAYTTGMFPEVVTKGFKNRVGLTAIYCLFDRSEDRVVYIGKAKDPWKRYLNHISPSGAGSTKVARWVAAQRFVGNVPIMAVLEWASDWEEAEKRWIAKLRASEPDLLNVADGGEHLTTRAPKPHLRGKISPFRKLSVEIGKLIAAADRDGRLSAANTMRDRMKFIRSVRRKLAQDAEMLSLYDSELCDAVIPSFENNQKRNHRGARRQSS